MSYYKTIFLLIDVEKYEYSTVNVYNVAISFFLFISMLRDTISWVRHDQEILYIISLALFLSAEQLCKITAGLRIHGIRLFVLINPVFGHVFVLLNLKYFHSSSMRKNF